MIFLLLFFKMIYVFVCLYLCVCAWGFLRRPEEAVRSSEARVTSVLTWAVVINSGHLEKQEVLLGLRDDSSV